MKWRQEWCSRADPTGAHLKDVVSFPLIVLIHSVLPMFWWKWCVWLAGRGVGWRHFWALLYIVQSAINLYPSSNFSAAKREVWGPCNSQGVIHTCIYHTSLLQNFNFSFKLCPGGSLCHISHSHPQTLLSFCPFLSILVFMDQSLCFVIYQVFTSFGSLFPPGTIVNIWDLPSQFSHVLLELRI